jgi:hypothetical protein
MIDDESRKAIALLVSRKAGINLPASRWGDLDSGIRKACEELRIKNTKLFIQRLLAHPPRFDYDWKNEKTLVITYKSPRGLVDFLIGLIHGVGKYFHEELMTTKLSADKVEVIFK